VPVATDKPPALAKPLIDLLIEMSVGLHKYSMYPDGHKLLDTAMSGVWRKLNDAIGDAPKLAIGVARSQLIIEGVPSDENSPVLRDLALKLYRRRIGGIVLGKDIDEAELTDLFRTIARYDATLIDMLLAAEEGKPPPEGHEKLPDWPHARLLPLSFNQLELGSDALLPGEEPKKGPGSWASQLWVQLARATVGEQAAAVQDPSELPQDPLVLARAIEDRKNDPEFDKGIMDIFPDVFDGIKNKGGMAGAALQRRLSTLVTALSPKTLRRVVDSGSTSQQRHELVKKASQALAADTVLDLVRAVAASEQHSMSESMLLLLSKMAKHSEQGNANRAYNADAALRLNVRQLVDDWGDAATLPEESYWSTLEQLVAQPGAPVAAQTSRIDIAPDRVVDLAIDLETLGTTAKGALQDMVKRGQIAQLMRMVDAMPESSKIVYQLRRHLVNTGTIRRLLQDRPPDFEVLERLVVRVGPLSAAALLDALEKEDDRPSRQKLLEMLAGLGTPIGKEIIARVQRAQGTHLRTLLALLIRIPELPDSFSALPYTADKDPSIRREAYTLLLKDPLARNKGIAAGLGDEDDGVNRIALRVAQEFGCPKVAVPVLARRLRDRSLDDNLGATAVRVLAPVRQPVVLESFVSVCRSPRRRFLLFPQLSEKSPVMLAALGALARGWASDPSAAKVIKLAYRSSDPEIQSMLDSAKQ
jgi:hypothetical protein